MMNVQTTTRGSSGIATPVPVLRQSRHLISAWILAPLTDFAIQFTPSCVLLFQAAYHYRVVSKRGLDSELQLGVLIFTV
jgi:hypothetical protein